MTTTAVAICPSPEAVERATSLAVRQTFLTWAMDEDRFDAYALVAEGQGGREVPAGGADVSLLSDASPVGKELAGARLGDVLTIRMPGGEAYTVQIVSSGGGLVLTAEERRAARERQESERREAEKTRQEAETLAREMRLREQHRLAQEETVRRLKERRLAMEAERREREERRRREGAQQRG